MGALTPRAPVVCTARSAGLHTGAPRTRPAAARVNPDFADFLAALTGTGARFLVVGAHALAVHGVPRATGDIDIWIDRSPDNAARVWKALADFGAPTSSIDIAPDDLATPNKVIQIGVPPRRIDVLTDVSGLEFGDAWMTRVVHRIGELDVPFIGRAALIRNKRASGRLKDLGDLEALGADPTGS